MTDCGSTWSIFRRLSSFRFAATRQTAAQNFDEPGTRSLHTDWNQITIGPSLSEIEVVRNQTDLVHFFTQNFERFKEGHIDVSEDLVLKQVLLIPHTYFGPSRGLLIQSWRVLSGKEAESFHPVNGQMEH
jgi:hypothetical protein